MLIVPDEIVTGALVNAIAVLGRQISKATSGLRKPNDDLTTARWFETFRLTGTLPDLPDVPVSSAERLTETLAGAEVQAALQELLAARLTDAPETDASRARSAVRLALSAAGPDAAAFSAALAAYYDDQICALVARLEGEQPPLLAQIRSEAFSSRMISILHAIEQHTAALANDERGRRDSQTAGGQAGDGPTATRAIGPPAGRPLAEVADPFALEVHRPVQADDPPTGLPALPTYVAREHDWQLAEVVRAAITGVSGIAVLVGGSSTGKTRACWEALGALRDRPEQWRLWHPIDPSRPEAALRELHSIGPRTVVWLNEAQLYLDVADGDLGERIAAGLRELLRNPDRSPVVVLATLWPQFWDRLTVRPQPGDEDPHAQARELLAGRDVSVPAAFTVPQMQQLAGAADPRLAQAAQAAEDGQVVQFLAGAPELMARYRNAPPAAAALIAAAIDARRLGMGVALPLAFLEAAAPEYLTDADWDRLGGDWLEQALAYTATPAKGIRGPLARIRSRASGRAVSDPGPAYRLADYLEQHGRRARRIDFPPAGFWAAAARFASRGDLAALARAAEARGLLRDAACLRRSATVQGNTNAAAELVQQWHSLHLHSADRSPARWAAMHVSVDDLRGVAEFLDVLRGVGAAEQAAVLADRVVAYAAVDDPRGVIRLLRALRTAGAADQAAALGSRVAAHVSLHEPSEVAELLRALRTAGAAEPTAALAGRVGTYAAVDDPTDVVLLLGALRTAGAAEQAVALAERAAACAAVDDPSGAARLLEALRAAGAAEQAAALAERAAACAAVDDPSGAARLLEALRAAGAAEQAVALAERAAAHAAVDDPRGVVELLGVLRDAGAVEQAAALARRAAAHVPLDNPHGIAELLGMFQRAGASEQFAILGGRVAAQAPFDRPSGLAELLGVLRDAGAVEQAAALAGRVAAQAPFDNPRGVVELLRVLRTAGAVEQAAALSGRVAAQLPIDDPSGIARLLAALRDAGAVEQAAALAHRAAVNAPLDNPRNVARLLGALRDAGAAAAFAALVSREPAAHTTLDNAYGVAFLLVTLRDAGAVEQVRVLSRRAAAHSPLDDPRNVARLLDALRDAGTADAIPALLARDPAGRISLSNPSGVAQLLITLRKAGADAQAAALLARNPAAHAELHNPGGVALLLRVLRQARAEGQVTMLADHVVAHAPLDDPRDVTRLLDALRGAEVEEQQVSALVELLPVGGLFDLFCQETGQQIRYRFGREPDGSPAPPWSWADLD